MRLVVALGVLLAALAIVAGGHTGTVTAAPPPTGVQPVIGLPASELVLAGAAPQGEPGEVWAYGELGEPASDSQGRPLDRGFVAVRHTDAQGWTVESPGGPEGFEPLSGPGAGRVTPRGGVVVAGAVGGRDPQLLVRDPGGDLRTLDAPPAPEVLEDGESLFDVGDAAFAAVDEPSGVTGVFVAAAGPSTDAAVLRWDGSAWAREPIVPDTTGVSVSVRAIAASSPDNAWLLAQVPDRGVVLFERVGATWEERPLGSSPFGDEAPVGTGIEALGPGRWPNEPLSVTDDRVWVDGTAQAGGVERDFTLVYDIGAGEVARSWCDIATSGGQPFCDASLGSELAGNGYRSFAFPGDGNGLRIVTNTPEIGGDDQSSHGTWLRIDDSGAYRTPGIGGSAAGGAFARPDDGWLGGGSTLGRVAPVAAPARLTIWPLNVRRPLTAAAAQPGTTPGDVNAGVLAVGAGGTVVRYTPGQGWAPEFLLNGVGQRLTVNLRGVAWPEPARVHAVGDGGEMWLWRAETGLWERDEGAPEDFIANLMGVAFDSADPYRGYAVGKQGVLLRYDKTWLQEPLPAGQERANFTSVAFAGRQALVAAERSLLVNEGGGWRVDASAQAQLDARPTARIVVVAGLSDGGAVAAGPGIVLVRDGPAAAWRPASRPLSGYGVAAAAAVREGDTVRAVVSVTTDRSYPEPDLDVPSDPGQPPPLVPPYPLADEGLVLRETATGWRDEQRAAWVPTTRDLPGQPDPVLALLLSPSGSGWAFGGITGEELDDSASSAQKAQAQSASAYRYEAGGGVPPAPPGVGRTPISTASGNVRFAVAGHAACLDRCDDLANQSLGPDVMMTAGLRVAAQLRQQQGGPRAFLYTGSRVEPSGGGLDMGEGERYAQLAASVPGAPPFYPAPGAGDAPDGNAAPFRLPFSPYPAPFGSGDAPDGIDTGSIPGAPANPSLGARTHYAFDSYGPEGAVRVIVIDNAAGSLAAGDPAQNPREPQEPWLIAVLDDARANGIPAIVVGNRSLDSSAGAIAAADADHVAALLVEHGASAYFADNPGENRARRIPAGAPATIPTFETGTLGYPSPQATAAEYFGETGLLLAEIDANARDPQTNRAPVAVRLLPVIEELAVDPTDGVMLRRSRPALFQGLGRLPRGGRPLDPTEAAPQYVNLPPTPCVGSAACATKITPEFTFTSADPDLGDFVAHDPQSINPRAVALGSDGKPISDATSGLFCPFNAGKTSVTISAGGFSYSQPVTILAGAVLRPCGTRPLDASRFRSPTPGVDVEQPSAQQPGTPDTPDVSVEPPTPSSAPAGQPQGTPANTPPRPIPPPTQPTVFPAPSFLVPAPPTIALVPIAPPPPGGGFARPTPPGGAVIRVFERQRDEEAAPEQSSAASAYRASDRWSLPGWSTPLLVLVLAAAAGTTAGRMRRDRRAQYAFNRSDGRR